jgi:hypothetical protein
MESPFSNVQFPIRQGGLQKKSLSDISIREHDKSFQLISGAAIQTLQNRAHSIIKVKLTTQCIFVYRID